MWKGDNTNKIKDKIIRKNKKWQRKKIQLKLNMIENI